MKGGDTSIHSNPKFAMPKNSNLLPHPGKEKPRRTTFDNQLIELESVDSTNNYAMARIHAGMASDGLVCLARHQMAGKGQRGKSWLDEPGQNLIMSLVIEPGTLKISQQFLFSTAVALGILDIIRTINNGNWQIKWPNDIYWNDRKAAGILIESVIQGKNWLFAVVGIGMNLNQESFPDEISNAISLKQITNQNYEPVTIARELVIAIQSRISFLRNDPGKILNEFNQYLYKRNEYLVLKKGNELISTKIIGVNETGELLTDMGSFIVGEVEFKFKA
ncbi:MAG TPA: biotin--[acetyl-CoA-carboxylase] ligase [Puia sp.]|nr:biotin--[acetyl-CoA-carboxylase] ligase [Puia sp.]